MTCTSNLIFERAKESMQRAAIVAARVVCSIERSQEPASRLSA